MDSALGRDLPDPGGWVGGYQAGQIARVQRATEEQYARVTLANLCSLRPAEGETVKGAQTDPKEWMGSEPDAAAARHNPSDLSRRYCRALPLRRCATQRAGQRIA